LDAGRDMCPTVREEWVPWYDRCKRPGQGRTGKKEKGEEFRAQNKGKQQKGRVEHTTLHISFRNVGLLSMDYTVLYLR
jgi:hypothetical protein